MSHYSLRVTNNSSNHVQFTLFQRIPDVSGRKDFISLAWLCEYANPVTCVEFSWDYEYSAVLVKPGQELKPGVVCETSQQVPVDIDGVNTVPDSLTEPGAVAGIAMSGSPVFVVPNQSNIDVTLTPTPQYYLVAGEFMKGQVLDVKALMARAIEIPYNNEVYCQSATLHKDNSLTLDK